MALIAAACGVAPQPAAETQGGLAFSDVAVLSGLGGFKHENGGEGKFWFPEQMGAGGGFVDYDGDGWEDIALVGGGRLSVN
ncbi:MAG: hypothetical protein R3282_10955, partial [Rhodothermales bacterium]|nr:hypothetical protein [Rhodothermales bacterium]